MRSIAGTQLIATVPERLARQEARDPRLRIVSPPPEMRGFAYLMVWHPRVDSDAAHAWLRETMRGVGHLLAGSRA
jgi:DNA-binding transcriptional LysR family regulator